MGAAAGSARGRATRFRTALLAGIYLIASIPVTFVFITHPGLTGHPDADFGRMVDGTANRPYVTRAFVPFLVRGVSAVIPAPLHALVADHMRDRRMVRLFNWDESRLTEYAIATLLFAGCFVGFAFVLRRLAAVVYGYPAGFIDLAPLIALATLPLCFRYYSYPYDPATLLLSSLGVLLVIEERLVPLVVVLVLAALNKETSVLLVGLYGLKRNLERRGGVILRTGALLLIWCTFRGVFLFVFRDRPGVFVETHVDHTVWLFTEFPRELWHALVVAALLAAVVVPGWRGKPRFLRAGLVLVIAPLLVAALFFGFADELRGYYEAAPFVFLLALPTIYTACAESA